MVLFLKSHSVLTYRAIKNRWSGEGKEDIGGFPYTYTVLLFHVLSIFRKPVVV